jgi:hypothetical protein
VPLANSVLSPTTDTYFVDIVAVGVEDGLTVVADGLTGIEESVLGSICICPIFADMPSTEPLIAFNTLTTFSLELLADNALSSFT